MRSDRRLIRHTWAGPGQFPPNIIPRWDSLDSIDSIDSHREDQGPTVLSLGFGACVSSPGCVTCWGTRLWMSHVARPAELGKLRIESGCGVPGGGKSF